MRLLAFLSLLALVLQESGTASLPRKERKRREEQMPREGDSFEVLPLGNDVLNPDNYGDVIDLSNYEELTDYGDQLPEVKVTSFTPATRISPTKSTTAPRTPSSNPTMTRPTTARLLLSSQPNHGLPTCLVCVCLGSSVYCDDIDLEDIPPLPRRTAYLYARFNRISRIRVEDFEGLTKLKRIDLSSNLISSIDNDAFRLLHALQDLILPENQLEALPVLPSGIEILDVRQNRLRSSGIQPVAFRAMEKLQFLYLSDNLLDSIPGPLPLSLRSVHLQNNLIETMQRDVFCDPEEHKHTRRQLEDIRLDGNPINLSLFPSSYFCLPRLPIGRFT
ncbi:PREDICTED: opticin [Colobus angolensis palliatus]|uniref:LRRNT domain-containing protein n=1 Tax=Colobus angolensis palliatus TaxID=336983 RepID=A0A2K5HBB4_COLAP|nr:PREDICTED: opticin [Colobus angolensis palliatus]